MASSETKDRAHGPQKLIQPSHSTFRNRTASPFAGTLINCVDCHLDYCRFINCMF